MERLYDLLFEVSSEVRHRVLILLSSESLNLSQLSRKLDLSLPEVSRHVSRLLDVEVIRKSLDGTYSLSSFGELVLGQIEEISFMSKNRDYFTSHGLRGIPGEFVSRLGELSESHYAESMMDFLKFIEETVADSNEYVWMQVNEVPYTVTRCIEDAMNKGTSFKIITHEDKERSEDITRITFSPLVESSTSHEMGVLLFVSKLRAAVSFPTHEGKYDYTGFTTSDAGAVKWCRDLYQLLWSEASKGRVTQKTLGRESVRRVTINGRDDPRYDQRAVQDAVDNYDEVTLRGVFNFGDSGITISKSCTLRGEGRENDVPSTKVYKKGWQMPFTSNEWLVRAKGEDTHIAIENLHFTDFNDICIYGEGGESLTVRNNRITLETGYNRGRRHPYGDMVTGIMMGHFGFPETIKYYPEGVLVEGNYLDFALSPLRRGSPSSHDMWSDPNYYPNLHDEYYCGVGMFAAHLEGKVSIKKNVVRNMNAAGINVSDCQASAKAEVVDNEIVTEVFGSHVHNWVETGFGITVHSAMAFPHKPGFSVLVSRNMIKCTKKNYGGIMIMGPFNVPEWAGKLHAGTVSDNSIFLDDGFVGIKVGRNDSIRVIDNVISGKAYYGIRVHGRDKPHDTAIFAEGNIVTDNNMTGLEIKAPDDYSNENADGVIFAGTQGNSETVHVWLDSLTKGNMIEIRKGEKVVDEGQNNKISYTDP